MKATRRIVTTGLLVAAQIILSRFLSISTPVLKIGFSFLPVALVALLYGPVYAAIASGAADLIGALLFPIGGYFPGFTFTAALAGLLYGLILYKKPQGFVRVLCAAVAVTLMELVLNTFWLYLITGKGFFVLLPTRLLQSAVMIPVKTLVIWKPAYFLLSLRKRFEN